ncbi:DgyrCDS6118 [Dimorphilus gyrociliatus]|uniref:DgyrCDS6118 n=1 Tax=Dimorphilus gyrociliatus TaxID=2664684 RepID=A0A7I8VM19_9ANNE|nr:DgyrCDS6118 [Dimorphilus gyrociliatus]
MFIKIQKCLVFVSCLILAECDIYLHNLRGSNNRLDEPNRERRNAKRLFDSQNNNRGGYNVGNVYYYSGSKLPIEWTNQHSCHDVNGHCEIIMQYMCNENLRDGATIKTIPENQKECSNADCDTDYEYGMHESYTHYLQCLTRARNEHLYTADQIPVNRRNKRNKVKDSTYTRQNKNGQRYGYECPEERDYYPYWAPSPWIDVAILTNDASRCPYYQEESENVKGRFYCHIPVEEMKKISNSNAINHNKEACEAFCSTATSTAKKECGWIQSRPHGVPAPDCRETEYTRDNHLGNGIGGYASGFNWTLPKTENKHCAFRIRYNISTGDYDGWNTNFKQNEPDGISTKKFGFSSDEEAKERGYKLKNNPTVDLFPPYLFSKNSFKLELAINTAQFGRTFQDRSHSFEIRKRKDEFGDKVIHNLNVRGKRGNIVQVYPAVEYDFVPNTMEIAKDDYIHFQWTGSNTNPNNNDGQGKIGTDRSNVILQREAIYTETNVLDWYDRLPKVGHWGRSLPQHFSNISFLGLSEEDKLKLAFLEETGELSELDAAKPYFDLGPRKVTSSGVYHYMSTRNNNFSNRSQKGRIISVSGITFEFHAIGWNGGNISSPHGTCDIQIERGTFDQLHRIKLSEINKDEVEQKLHERNGNIPNGKISSHLILIEPDNVLAAESKKFQMKIRFERPRAHSVTVYHAWVKSDFATWSKIDAEVNDDMVQLSVSNGGAYVVTTHSNVGMIVGIVFGTLAVILIVVVLGVFYLRKNPKTYNNIKRKFQSKL